MAEEKTLLPPKTGAGPANTTAPESTAAMTKLEQHLLLRNSPTYTAYYNGKMSYALRGQSWETYISEAFPDLKDMNTSENVFKAVIDLYADNLVPMPDELRGFSNCVVPLLSRGECVVVVDSARTPHFAEHFEMISDGNYTVTAVFTRSIKEMEDYVTFVHSDGTARLFYKKVPDDFSSPDTSNYMFREETSGWTLFRFALDDKGFGATMAALQDRVNHSILDQTVVAEMYARPFWYLLNVDMPAVNPYMAALGGYRTQDKAMDERKTEGAAGRIFTTSSEGPFGQLEPPTITDMIAYHDSISDKVSQSSGIPQYYFKPGDGTPPTGVALKVLSKRFNNKVARMREDIEPVMTELAVLLGVEKTKEVEVKEKPKAKRGLLRRAADAITGREAEADPQPDMEYEFWNTSDDLLQESLDAHGISLSQMGYPLKYIAEVVTPGVDLDDYEDDTMGEQVNPQVPGQATDMTATGQTGLPATPGQVASYAQNPGQRAVQR